MHLCGPPALFPSSASPPTPEIATPSAQGARGRAQTAQVGSSGPWCLQEVEKRGAQTPLGMSPGPLTLRPVERGLA